MARLKTNVECVKDIMEFSDFGPLAQAFVMDALGKMADKIASTPIDELNKAFSENPMISATAWQGVAKEIKTKIDRHFAH